MSDPRFDATRVIRAPRGAELSCKSWLTEAAFRKGALIGRALRAAGVGVEVHAPAKMKRLMELANKAGARYALLIGDDELAAGRYGLKDMASGEQRAVAEEELLGIING